MCQEYYVTGVRIEFYYRVRPYKQLCVINLVRQYGDLLTLIIKSCCHDTQESPNVVQNVVMECPHYFLI